MAARPLSEVYSGSLSRNWAKFREVLDNDEIRAHVYVVGRIQRVAIAQKRGKDHYDICNAAYIDFTWEEIAESLEKECIGFFPANESEL